MQIQLLSDLHLETEAFTPTPAPGAEVLVLAGDIDSRWDGLTAFANWPVPVIFVPGNHEYDRRELTIARLALAQRCTALGLICLDDRTHVHTARDGRRIRFIGSTRWSDFDVFGESQRERAMRAAAYFQRVMQSTWNGEPLDAAAVRCLGLKNRAWLAQTLAERPADVDLQVVITHFAPSLRSADPRYGKQPGTASFCNNDEALMVDADWWLHGHLHCRHHYSVGFPDGHQCRVACNARGHARKGEADGHDGHLTVDLRRAPA